MARVSKKTEEEIKKPVKKTTVKKEDNVKIDETKKEEVREVIVERKSGFNYLEVIIIMFIMLVAGFFIGTFVSWATKTKPDTIITTDNKEIPSEFNEFIDAYNNIVNDYYQEIDNKKLIEAGISGMLEYLGDDYSVYMDTDESDNFNAQVEGEYRGIGIEIVQNTVDKTIMIYAIFENTPASRSDLKVGDIITKVNGKDTKDMTTAELAKSIKSSNSGSCTITILRDDVEKIVNVSLDNVVLNSVSSKVINESNKKIGYISLDIFAANTATQFEKELIKLEGNKIDSLIIDVRDNTGGYLNVVTDIASLFLDKTKVIYQLDTKGVIEQIYSKTNTSRKYPVVVLMNGYSASASEILAGALKESYGATLIGTHSFGKGTVQKAYQLESGATVKYTIQKWLTPNGNWINGTGIEPDIKVELDENYFTNPVEENDNQLRAAIDKLTNN